MKLEGTIAGVLAEAAGCWPGRTAVVTGGGSCTFQELHERARAVAKGVMAAGLQAGDRFAIWAPNSLEWQLAALGGQLAGGVLVPINTRYKGREAGDLLRRSQSRLTFTVGRFLGTDYPAMVRETALPELRQHVVLGAETETETAASADGLASFADFIAAGSGVPDRHLDQRIAGVKGESLSDVLYTSGTTGAPKGVMTTHGQNVAVFQAWAKGVTLAAADRYLIVNPYFHAFGYKAGWLAGLLTGACIYPMAVFDVDAALDMIDKESISFLPGPPTLFQSLLAHPARGGKNLASLRCAVTGAASVPVQLVKDMKHELGFAEVYTAYGLTESTGVVSLCRPGDDFATIAKTSGRAMEGVEIQITAEDGQPLPAGETGEIWVRGFNVMQGYLDDPEATAATITQDGWLRTGDLGQLDRRGYLKITDRLKDMYICGGFNCYPAEIEQTLLSHPSVADVAVLGVPEPRLGEVGHAFAVAAPGAEADRAALLEWAKGQMANYKLPRHLTWLPELPRNASGKVQKFLLRESLGP